MLDELLKIARLCDSRKEWTDEQWKRTLTNCILKKNYIIKVKGEEISAFSCWLFLRNLDKIDNKYIEDDKGTIAYIQCAYVKEGSNGLLRKMIQEGVNKYKDANYIFYCHDRFNNKKILIPVKKWRSDEKTD